MGVPKLKKFVSSSKGWDTIQVSGKVVIDGNSLCYNLNKQHEWKFGGDYKDFYETVTVYIRELKALGIEPYIVVDGMDHDDSKYQTYIARNEDRINRIAISQSRGTTPHNVVRPLFTQTVFVDAVRDSKTKFFVADGEADRDIALLANSLSCPVISEDSDFFIFNIEAGYIPLNGDDQQTRIDLQKPVKRYQYKEFDESFSLNQEQRLFFPFILGNDFHNGAKQSSLQLTSRTPLHAIARKLSTLDFSDATLTQFVCPNPISQMEKIKLYYRGTAQSFDDLTSTSSLLELYPHTPEWIMQEYKNGRFMAPIMSLATCPTTKRWRHTIVVEDFSQQSAWKITEIAKKFIIGALLGDEANKHHIMATAVKTSDKPSSHHRHRIQSYPSVTRVDSKLLLMDTEVILAPKHTTILSVPLKDVPQVPVTARKEIMYRVFHYTEPAESDIPEGLQLAMIAGRCWVRKVACDNTHLIQSLVCCILTCYGHFQMIDRKYGCKLAQHEILFFLHSYAQWQCLLHHVIAFNQVLSHPFPYTSPARLFSSSLLLHFYQQTSQVLQEKMDTLATSMLQIITESKYSTESLKDIELEPSQTKKRRTTY
ncbi:protein asteroid homolog 1-like [Halichondria panicea]|uniref:protein asteroid homolog 1-like n=1 Tax=Halichondria panicea TaxID=6063 RepID=UPI00312B668E